ncbi:replication protein A 70 kDa DNA-binding subunit E-like [Daphnia pulicaria]|uniref:replication protein A 70 kDa DNA-binding subunit E-like n=1 Tax=Daphnia pulicaria TaxID=35523 RepID=UPI001EEACA11|nr:replication protein A 70 kDa DNA-binding subunit E-like [Daphnia pulicaria]
MLHDSGSESDSDVSGKEVSTEVNEEPVSGQSVVKEVFIDVNKLSPDLRRWKIRGRVSRISRLFSFKGDRNMFYFGLLDSSGLLKVKAFYEDAEKYYGIVEEGKFFSIEYARVSVAKNPNNIFPLKFEVILAKESEVEHLEQDDTFPRLKVVKYDLKKVRDLPHGTFFDIEVIVYKAGCVVDVRKGELRKLELEVFDASMKPGETVKVTLWNDDIELVSLLDLRKFYYKLSIQDATCNEYLQREYIQTSKASVFKIAKVECDSTESRVVSLWKAKKFKDVGETKRKSDHVPVVTEDEKIQKLV